MRRMALAALELARMARIKSPVFAEDRDGIRATLTKHERPLGHVQS